MDFGFYYLLLPIDTSKKTEVSFMNREQKASIIRMRSDGMTFSEIANQLQLSINTVKSFYRRNAKTKSQLEACMNCGKPIVQTKHKRQRNSARINAVTFGGLHIPKTADLKNYTVIYAHIVVLFFKVTVQKANIVLLGVLPMQDARRTEYDKGTI